MNATPTASDPARKVKALLRVTSGHFLEMFDFILFGFYAPHIAKAFFPASSEFASLMLTFATFGAGFLMRPLGGIILGGYLDRVGRRKGLIVTLTMMAIATLIIAFTPTYATIGVAAPLLVLVARLLQGFSAGAELGGVAVYLTEMATPGHKGFYVAWQSVAQQVGVILAALLGFGINAWMAPAEIASWGWRIPFAIGCLMVPFLFMIRRSLEETDEFLARKKRPETREVFTQLVANFGTVLTGVLLVSMTNVSFYLIAVYTPTFGDKVLHLSTTDSLLAALGVGVSNAFWLPIMGALSDRVGRWPVLIGFSLLAIATAYPAIRWLVQTPDFTHLLLVSLWLSLLYSGYNGALYIALAEVMPPEIRTAAFSFAFGVSAAIFGGFTPAIATWLVHALDNKAAPGLWMSVGAACGLIASLIFSRQLMRRRASGQPSLQA
ncbi:MAG TPA: MFS transporter [Burkholderiaceae bacterium]|jgi:MHS family citrate/tricarballylate:H+ symporter-like MFS transporter